MIKSEICDMIGVKYPIIQGGLGPFETANLAAAISNAGALGMISHPLRPSPEIIRDNLKNVVKLTDNPLGVNIRVAREDVRTGAPQLIDAILEERQTNKEVEKRLKVFLTGAGDPTPFSRKIRDEGLLHFHLVPSVYHAKRAENAGVDVIIASGHEAGGHVHHDPVHTLVLVPSVVKSVKIPVVASGGFCDGAGLAAALSLGAEGMFMGTRFVATEECLVNLNYKKAIVNSSERDTIVLPGFLGPIRYLKNEYTTKLQKMVDDGVTDSRRMTWQLPKLAKAGLEEDINHGHVTVGMVAGRIESIPKVKDLIDGIIKEAEETIDNLNLRVKN